MLTMDWVALAMLLGSLLLGVWRGLLYEVFSVGGWVLAFVLAPGWAEPVGRWLPLGDTAEPLRHALGFGLVFVGVVFAVGALAWLVRRLARAVGLRPADRVFGALFGLVRGVLLLLLLGWALQLLDLHDQPWWRDSLTAQGVQLALGQWQAWLLPLWSGEAV